MRKTNVLGLGTNKIRGNDLVYRQTVWPWPLTLGLYLHTKGCQLSIGLSLMNTVVIQILSIDPADWHWPWPVTLWLKVKWTIITNLATTSNKQRDHQTMSKEKMIFSSVLLRFYCELLMSLLILPILISSLINRESKLTFMHDEQCTCMYGMAFSNTSLYMYLFIFVKGQGYKS